MGGKLQNEFSKYLFEKSGKETTEGISEFLNAGVYIMQVIGTQYYIVLLQFNHKNTQIQ
jgi:hypothetical protein